MTLVIDKSLSTQRLLFTANEIYSGFTGVVLNVFNLSTNVDESISLGEDVSPYPNRYNDFQVETNSFSALTKGTYSFRLSSNEAYNLETGLLKVVDEVQTPEQEIDSNYTYIEPTSTDDDYVIYQP